VWAYRGLEETLIAARHRRARALRDKLALLPPAARRRAKLTGLPLVNRLEERRVLNRMGPSDAFDTLIARLKPDLVVGIWSRWANPGVFDSFRAARKHGIKSMLINANWDGLCLTGGFPVMPDYLGVWGEQTLEHAVDILDFPPERTFKLGSPGFQQYFDFPPEGVPSPFPFRYALYIGTHAQYEECVPIERLNRLIDERGLDLKLVYRPYAGRYERNRPDFVDESKLEHVIIDPDVRDQYLQEFGIVEETQRPPYPTITYHPALLSNAEFVVCSLSTMIVEAGLLDKRVVIPSYNDSVGSHYPVTLLARCEIFDGMEDIHGFTVARSEDELAAAFERYTGLPPVPPGTIRNDPVMRWWLHWDERTFAERLAAAIEEIVLGAPRERVAMLA
jgi:hypothetical protein